MSIKDRGMKKWYAAAFLPQHTEMLKQMNFNGQKVSKPQLDVQQLEELQIVSMESLHNTLPIKLKVWRNGFFIEFKGIIDTVNEIRKEINIEVEDKNTLIKMDEIISTERI